MLEIENSPLDAVCERESKGEAIAILRAWEKLPGYLEQRNFLLRLIQWGKEERETREEVGKEVIRELSGRGDVLQQLAHLLRRPI